MGRVFAFVGMGSASDPRVQGQLCGLWMKASIIEVAQAGKKKPGEFLIQKPTGRKTSLGRYLICFETSLVISNMLTDFLPPKTTLRLSSALICVRFLASWSLFFLM